MIYICASIIFGLGVWVGYFWGWNKGFTENSKLERDQIMNALIDGMAISKQGMTGIGATIDPSKFFNVKVEK